MAIGRIFSNTSRWNPFQRTRTAPESAGVPAVAKSRDTIARPSKRSTGSEPANFAQAFSEHRVLLKQNGAERAKLKKLDAQNRDAMENAKMFARNDRMHEETRLTASKELNVLKDKQDRIDKKTKILDTAHTQLTRPLREQIDNIDAKLDAFKTRFGKRAPMYTEHAEGMRQTRSQLERLLREA